VVRGDIDVYSSVLRGLFLWDGARNSVTLLLHHGLNSFCPEPTGALRIGVLSPRITCAYYQPHTKSQRLYLYRTQKDRLVDYRIPSGL
jgi:hypothetical protein